MTASFCSIPSRLRALRPLALAVASLCAGGALQAAGPVLPAGLQVQQGQATLQTSGRQLTVTNSAGALLNWQQFSIGAGDAVRFVQPTASSKVLNRVVGPDPSTILGSLSSNGQVWLLNPNGVLFGAGARVDVAGLVASTLRVDDGAWRAGLASGRVSLGGAADGAFSAAVVNEGALRSTSGGRVLLIGGAGGVRNAGLIEAPDGQVVLAAGSQVDLVDSATPRLGLQLRAPQGEVLNLGQLSASGGRIDLQAALVNQQGIVRADSLGQGSGGQVLISASQGINLGAASRTSADGAAGGGQVQVDAGGGTLLAAGQISAVGGSGLGGSLALLGRQVGLQDGALADASGASGGGALRVGGGLRGTEPGWRLADAVHVAPGATLRADALVRGNGGLVVLWGSQSSRAYGSFSARGGALGGDGGFIETSGGWIDVRPQAVDTRAPAGRAGQWLIDPDDLLITSDGFDTSVSAGPDFSTTGSPATLSTFSISQALNANTNVTIATSDSAGNSTGFPGRGDITLRNAFLNVAPTQPVSLTINATGSLLMQNASIQTLNAPLTVQLVAGALGGRVDPAQDGGGGQGGGIALSAASIATAGGDIILGGPTLACGPVLACSAGNTGAVAHSGSTLFDGVSISGSTLRAGSGRIQIDGHSLVGFTDTAGVRIQAGSQLEGSRISMHGTVDAAVFSSGGSRQGVVVTDSGLAATEALRITGSVHSDQSDGGGVTAYGVDIGRNSLLRVGVADTAAPDPGTAPGLLVQGKLVVQGGNSFGLPGAAVRLADNGTRLVALGGVGIDILGDSTAPGGSLGILMDGNGSEIDASAGSALRLETANDMRLSGRIRAPNNGSLNLLAGGSFSIDDALIDGAPATVTLNAATLGIGTNGDGGTRLEFSSDALVSVRAGSFAMGLQTLNEEDGEQFQTSARTGQQRALGRKRALADVALPALDSLAVLATGGRLDIAADTVLLGDDQTLYAGAAGTALRITGSNTGTPVQSFVNQGGGSALQTPNGHWQLEAADSADGAGAGFQPGGLRADFWQYGAAPGSAPAAAGNGFLFAAAPVLGLQSADGPALAKAYDGSDAVDLAGLNLAVTGLRPGQALAGNLKLADRAAGEARPLLPGLGSLGQTVVADDGTPVFGYAFDAATLQVSVTPLTLNLSAVQAANKVYDGNSSAAITRWTLSGVLEGDQVLVASGSANFSDANVGNAKLVTASATALGGLDAGNYRLASSNSTNATTTISTTADISPAMLRYEADRLRLLRGDSLPALTGTVLGLVGADTLSSATQGQLLFQTTASSASEPGLYAINGSGLTAQNYQFSQAPSNATALVISALPSDLPTSPAPVNTLVTRAAVAAVLPSAQGSAAGVGRTLDVLPGLLGNSRNNSFGTLDLDTLSPSAVAAVLAARDAFKKEVFREALNELEANPAAADAAGCATAQQAASGQCLVMQPLGTGLDISNARVVERAALAAPRRPPPPLPPHLLPPHRCRRPPRPQRPQRPLHRPWRAQRRARRQRPRCGCSRCRSTCRSTCRLAAAWRAPRCRRSSARSRC